MEIKFSPTAKADLAFWKRSGNIRIQTKINLLLQSILENPNQGIGKPEKLKHSFSGTYSRRISSRDRMVYEVRDEVVFILSLKGHYE